MKVLYFDMQYGVSGDMINAALLDMYDLFELLIEKLSTLPLEGFKINFREEKRNQLTGGRFQVITDNKQQPLRTFKQIKELILSSELSEKEKELAIKVFEKLGAAESKVHGVDISRIHFHEVGAIDSIVDIISFAVLYNSIEIDKTFSSPFYLGRGKTKSMHGEIPIPAPATVEIIKGLPSIGTENNYEMTTPTGASIITTITELYTPIPPGKILSTGMGFGTRKENLNALRVFEIETDISGNSPVYGNPLYNRKEKNYAEETIMVIETTIDDSSPEEIAYFMDQLLKEGALDVFTTPITMKKSRPGFNITILVRYKKFEKISDLALEKSSTFGIRYYPVQRKILGRKIISVKTEYGKIKVKIGFLKNGSIKISPEYESCLEAAEKYNVSLREVFYNAVEKAKNHTREEKI